MKITVEKLIKFGACLEARSWIVSEFPKGAELMADVLARCQRDDWVCWLACKLDKSYRWWCAGLAFREASKCNPLLLEYSMNVTEENWRKAKKAAADAAAAADNAAAAYADAARTRIYAEMRLEAERVLLSL